MIRTGHVLLLATLMACAESEDDAGGKLAPDELGEGKEDAPAPGPDVPLAEQSADIGQFFMIDHYGVEAAGFGFVKTMIRDKNLGSIILWNPTGASGETLRKMLRVYSQAAAAAGRDELFYAADQEERRTQRFSSAQGFTRLVSGNVLGQSIVKHGNAKLCDLHARITAKEMASVGMNMSLGTVSDLYVSNSGTRGMFVTRAIDSEPSRVSQCITAMTGAYAQEQHVVFITKHFPGLGNATGNTDVDLAVKTRATTKAAMERELTPYRSATAAIEAAGTWKHFGAMISHASYPVIDGGARPATLSPALLTNFMRGASNQEQAFGGRDASGNATSFAGMGFRGLTVSDAFWTWGATRDKPAIERQRLMARAFLAGMDILMISKSDFNGAWGYFQLVYADRMPEAEKAALVAATGFTSWDALRAAFRARITESATRIREVKAAVGLSTSFMGTGPARDASTDLVPEYKQLGS